MGCCSCWTRQRRRSAELTATPRSGSGSGSGSSRNAMLRMLGKDRRLVLPRPDSTLCAAYAPPNKCSASSHPRILASARRQPDSRRAELRYSSGGNKTRIVPRLGPPRTVRAGLPSGRLREPRVPDLRDARGHDPLAGSSLAKISILTVAACPIAVRRQQPLLGMTTPIGTGPGKPTVVSVKDTLASPVFPGSEGARRIDT